jgi:hypothetical protein
MNRLHYYLFCLFTAYIGIAVTGCKSKATDDKPASESAVVAEDLVDRVAPVTIQLSPSKKYEYKFKCTDLVDDIHYIPLETTNNSLLGNSLRQIQLTENFIFLNSDGILFQFDRQGKFVRKINKKGQGPGECDAFSVGIDEKNRRIYILDLMKQSISIFDFEGIFLRAFRHPFTEDANSPESIGCDNKGNILFTFGTVDGKGEYKYVAVNEKVEILYQCPNYDRYDLKERVRAFAVSPQHPIYEYNTFSYYVYSYNDTVFRINDDYTCSPAWIVRLPNKITLEERLKTYTYMEDWSTLSGKNYFEGIREDKRRVYIYHTRNVYPEKEYPTYLSIYDKQTGQLIENINPLIKNDWDGGMDVKLTCDQKENILYKLLQPFKMKEILTDDHFSKAQAKYSDKQKALQTMVNTMMEDDNPVLMIVTLK